MNCICLCMGKASTSENYSLKRSAQVQYNYNTTAIQELFSRIAVVLHLCGPLQYSAAIQVYYNLQKTCRLLAAVVTTCIAVVLCLCGLLQYNKIFVLCYCSCIALVWTALVRYSGSVSVRLHLSSSILHTHTHTHHFPGEPW